MVRMLAILIGSKHAVLLRVVVPERVLIISSISCIVRSRFNPVVPVTPIPNHSCVESKAGRPVDDDEGSCSQINPAIFANDIIRASDWLQFSFRCSRVGGISIVIKIERFDCFGVLEAAKRHKVGD